MRMSFPSIQVQMMERARAIASFDSVQMAEIIYGRYVSDLVFTYNVYKFWYLVPLSLADLY
jgi:hypothetical protein